MPHARRLPSPRTILTVVTLLSLTLGVLVAPPARAVVPVAAKFSPAAAPAGAGITVTGTGFLGTTRVKFQGGEGTADDVVASHFIVIDAKKLVVQVPDGASSGPIRVTNPDGASSTTGSFTVLQPPAITAVSADWGAPNTEVTIDGTNLMGVKKPVIAFGAKKVPALAGSTQTQLKIKVPSGLKGGSVPLSVTTTGGRDSRDFVIGPFVKAAAPAVGTTAGGTVVSVVGAGFTGVESVTIGGTEVPELIAVSDKEVVVRTPAGDGAGPVVVTTRHGSVTATSGDLAKFTYLPLPSVTGVSANYNAVNEPSPVVFTGTNLTETTTVTVGGLPAASVVADAEAGTLEVTPAQWVKPAVNAAVFANTAPSGVVYKTTVPFAFVTKPTVTKLAPLTAAAGAKVAVSGTGFTSDSTAFFGETEAECTIVSFALLSCTAPPGEGPVPVTVDNGVDVSAETLATTFTYLEGTADPAPVVGLPTVANLLPPFGADGSTVDIRGANLSTLTKVEFTGPEETWVEADTMLVVGPGRAVVTVPEQASTGEIRLTSPRGAVETLGRVFTKTVRPSIEWIDAVGDTTYGVTPGDLVKIRGEGLIVGTAKTAVTIGGKIAPIVTKPAPNPRTIVVRVPAGIGSRQPLVVTTALGRVESDVQLYYLPEIKSVKPKLYTRGGGTVVTLAGAGFTGIDNLTVGDGRRSAVTFAGVNAARIVVMSDKTVFATTAKGSASADRIVVTTQHDGRFGNSDGKTRSVAAPIARIDSVSPDSGPTGVSPPAVTLTGQHLYASSVVKFGSGTGSVQSAAADGSSLVVVPPTRGTTAVVSITVTNTDDGDALTTTLPDAYTYVLQPAIISQLSATTAKPGATLTVTGSSFQDVSSVRFGTTPASYTVVNSTTLFVTVPVTPPGAGGTVTTITVVNGTGQPSTASPATAAQWTWDSTPVVSGLSASTGPMGMTVTISGANFIGVTKVRFGDTQILNPQVVDENTIDVVVPATPATLGGVKVDVIVEVGTFVSTPVTPSADDWIWMAGAVVTSMSHNTAPAGTTVTVTGTGFVNVSAVVIHNKPVASYQVLSSTSLTFVVPVADASGPTSVGSRRDVRITNGSGLLSTASPDTADDWTFQ